MPADKNLILWSNAAVAGTTTSPSVDIGMGGTPITSPLVARLFFATVAATATLNLAVEASYDNTNWRTVASGAFGLTPIGEPTEYGVRFITRRRYVRASVNGATLTGATVQIVTAARSSPEQFLD